MNGIILYQSKYGATKKYAQWLSEETGFCCVAYLRVHNKGQYLIYSFFVFVYSHNLMPHLIKLHCNVPAKPAKPYQ